MARKTVSSEVVDSKPIAELSFFECAELIHEIELRVQDADGEISDDQMQALVEAQTQVPAKLHKLCNFLKLLEAQEKICKDRIAEIKETQARAKSLRERLSGYVASFVDAQGKSYHVAEYELKSRASTSVSVPDGFDDPMFCRTETKIIVTPDKKAIKEALQANEEVPGCELVTKLNLSIK
jgi:phosphoserine phosphatase